VALPLPVPVRAEVNSLVHVFKRMAPGVRWVKADHLHITLRFLGDVEDPEAEVLIDALESLTEVAPFRFNLAGIGAFPDRKRPRAIWTGIAGGKEEVISLAETVERIVESCGFPREPKRFSPHVTLGRVKSPGNFDDFWPQAEATPFVGKSTDAVDVRLIWSTLTTHGPVYRDVESFPLRGTK
jgi:2'-5' RNA ligase